MAKKTSTPDQDLAAEIIDNLIAADLVPKQRKEIIRTKLITGTASEIDWRGWIDTARTDSERREVQRDAE